MPDPLVRTAQALLKTLAACKPPGEPSPDGSDGRATVDLPWLGKLSDRRHQPPKRHPLPGGPLFAPGTRRLKIGRGRSRRSRDLDMHQHLPNTARIVHDPSRTRWANHAHRAGRAHPYPTPRRDGTKPDRGSNATRIVRRPRHRTGRSSMKRSEEPDSRPSRRSSRPTRGARAPTSSPRTHRS